MSLTIKEFRRLSREEKEQRFSELSSHDKVIARMEDSWAPSPNTPRISIEELMANPPKGWECLTWERIEKMFPEEIKKWRQNND